MKSGQILENTISDFPLDRKVTHLASPTIVAKAQQVALNDGHGDHLWQHESAMFQTVRSRLDQIKGEGLYRQFLPCERLAANPGTARHHHSTVEVWCSNDYLGLSQHPAVIEALTDSARVHGTGTGGSRNIAGTSPSHVTLENRLAAWHDKEKAVVFNSGYTANFEFLSTLIDAVPDLVVFSDSLNHRSLIEGIRRRKCTTHVFPHNDLAALESLLARYPLSQSKMIVCESIYSMDGDISNIEEICDLADKYQALTFLDETHAIGILGETGAGLCEAMDESRVTFIQGVCGKSMGVLGGYIAGPESVLDYVRSVSPGFIFTTALPQAMVDAILSGLDIIQNDHSLREKLFENVTYLKENLAAHGIECMDGESHLVLVLVPGAERVKAVAKRMLDEHNIYVQPINFPSVPRGEERFRLSVAPSRRIEEIDTFIAALKTCMQQE